MLVLSRHVGETIHVGDDVVVTVTGIEPGRVKLGFAAPKEVSIDRGEVRRDKARGGTPRSVIRPESLKMLRARAVFLKQLANWLDEGIEELAGDHSATVLTLNYYAADAAQRADAIEALNRHKE